MTTAGDLLFAYGTLRTGQVNAERLLGRRPHVPAVLPDHELRLGAWPWVRPAAGSDVVGEVVAVEPELLAELDRLEDVPGGLYRRERCTVRTAEGGEAVAWTYTAGSVATTGNRPVPGGDWLTAFVWYVGYGSNLSAARFRRYLDKCRDPSEPWRWAAVEVPHRLVFARDSTTWGGGGVAFLDPAATPGAKTLGRAWLVTWEQFADVLAQECGLPVGSVEIPALDAGCVITRPGHWYGCVVPLGHHGGWPMVTFTDEASADLLPTGPGVAYRAVVSEGLAEAHGLSPEQAADYIARHSL